MFSSRSEDVMLRVARKEKRCSSTILVLGSEDETTSDLKNKSYLSRIEQIGRQKACDDFLYGFEGSMSSKEGKEPLTERRYSPLR